MGLLFFIVPVFIGVVFLIIAFQLARRAAEWARNNGMPVEAVPARVVSRRTETRGRASHHSHGHVWTNYFVTFEVDSASGWNSTCMARITG